MYALTDITPKLDPEVAEWLIQFAGDDHTGLLNWLRLAPDTSQELPPLVLVGPPEAGKTFLTASLSFIWGLGSWTVDRGLIVSGDAPLLVLREPNLMKVSGDSLSALTRSDATIEIKHKEPVRVQGARRVVVEVQAGPSAQALRKWFPGALVVSCRRIDDMPTDPLTVAAHVRALATLAQEQS